MQLATIHADVFPDMNACLASTIKTVPNLVLLGKDHLKNLCFL